MSSLKPTFARHGYQAKGGQMLDATIVPVPKQHISKEEKEQLDRGEIPQDWQENPHRLSQRDTLCALDQEEQRESFWLQRPQSASMSNMGLYVAIASRSAAVHDSIALPDILDEDNEGDEVWAEACLSQCPD